MTLSVASNTINALGIFGRLEAEQEKYFHDLERKYSLFPENEESVGIFSHLSLVINKGVPVGEMEAWASRQ